ncbi:glycosyltransferase family 4 protein [Amycolatopsis anabasis]|uniref:glycosyltransferase family 4 protein n=1 Tax=Amycolatopsis anabasis TaxID=1840409 RepID=UPI00131BBF9C|nr:glycosyltransferase family 4 protein [Amycolatopsis anabasis]
MRLLVYPHAMEIGGSQLNAVQLAGVMAARGHRVLVVSEPGPLVDRVRELGLEHVEIPLDRRRPSPEVLRTLARLVRERRIDLVHGYEWPPVVEALFGPGLLGAVPVLGTVMSMSVVPFFPRTVPLIVGTERIREAAVAAGHRRVTLLEPWVDTESDSPVVDGRGFRAAHGIAPDEIVIAMVCRLVPELKREGLLAACDAVGELAASGRRVRLAIVGDGRCRAEIAERAAKANAQAGREAVLLTGEIADPRPAYAAADILVGMGGSALRGMAFGAPLVVVGEDGFSETLTRESTPLFLRQGWYGLGPGTLGSGAPALRRALERLADSPGLRRELGGYARKLVTDRFSLARAADVQEHEYLRALSDRVGEAALLADIARSGAGIVGSTLARKYRRWRGGAVATDDANARPLAGPARREG